MRKIALLFFVLLFTLPPMTANAQIFTAPFKNASPSAKRQEIKAAMQAKREEFKEKLQTIKDVRKKANVEKIDTKLKTINAQKTARMLEALDKMSLILEKVSTKAAALKTSGKDTTSLDYTVTSAKTSIATAKTAVSEQQTKEYVVTVENEATLKSTVGQTTSQLEQDLKTVHKLVMDAKQAVMKVVSELAKLQGEKSASNSGVLN